VRAVEVLPEVAAEGVAHDHAGILVGGTHKGRLAGLLLDVDRDDRHLRPLGADVGGRRRVGLEGDEPVHLAGAELAGAAQGLGGVKLAVAGDDFNPGDLGRLLHAGLQCLGKGHTEPRVG
jgi:hypothetical protein